MGCYGAAATLFFCLRANRRRPQNPNVLCSSETPMWFPVELHCPSAQRGGLPAALKAALEQHAHYHIVDERRIANLQCDSSPNGVASTFAKLDDCSATYIGARHMSPVAPFCAFTMAPELGIAYLEHLIDYEPLAETRFGERWLASALYGFVHMLLRDHETLSAVVLPLPIDGDPPAGYTQVSVDDRYHIKRTEP
ncbi:hypothetical protein RMSM_00544 [Rhodopirellula maiorica SM1]|uniref:Uncharacterized protein n=1 Tax=Rhodopirellula maiorica SM1 TaxID=1265738 RepID=M5S8L6_9BACT|nr:hypothetical protein RMSM_00544 [Rhodopirellula maiorica SM1]